MRFRTKLSAVECKGRLADAIDPEKIGFSWSGYAGSKPMLGRIRDNGFRLQKRRDYRNSFAPFFYGQFVMTEGSTMIEGEFRMHPFVKTLMAVWFSLLSVFTMAGFILSIKGESGPTHTKSLAVLVPLAMAGFGIVLLKFGQWFGRHEEGEIITFLKTTLQAEDS